MTNISIIDFLRSFYHKNIKIYNMIVRAIATFIVFFSVIKSDYFNSPFVFLDNMLIVLLISALLTFISTVLDIRVFMMLFCVFVPISVSSNLLYTLVAFVVLMLIFIFFGSVLEQYATVMMFTVCCCYLKVPYLAPIYLGLNKKSNSLIALLLGLIMFYTTLAVNNGLLYANYGIGSLEEIVLSCIYLLNFVLFDTMFLALFFSYIITYLLSSYLKYAGVDNNTMVSIVSSGIIFIILAIFNVFLQDLNNNIIIIMFEILLSMVLTYVLCSIDCVYDYKKSSKVYFQDDENIYYVKIVPKVE